MQDLIGIVISFIYFFGLLFLSKLFKKNLELSRKFVHILLGNWWLIVVFFFSSVWTASVVPFAFIFINYISVKRNRKGGLLSDLERKTGKKSYGIVAYPISMLLLVIISFSLLKQPYIGGIGLLALSYGDGFAALIGQRFNYKPVTIWGNRKTLSGSAGMFIATFLSIFIFLMIVQPALSFGIVIPTLIVVALISSVFEMFTPFGLDNITVPFSALGVFYISVRLFG